MESLVMASPSLRPTSDILSFKVGDVVNLKGFKHIKMVINAILPNYQVQLIYANDILNFLFLTVHMDCIELHQEDD